MADLKTETHTKKMIVLRQVNRHIRHFSDSRRVSEKLDMPDHIKGFITKILNDKSKSSDFERIEAIRKQMVESDHIIEVEDFGAGSRVMKSNRRKVKDIVRYSVKNKKFGQLLYRTVHYFSPPFMLELGTSFGITSAYLALGNPGNQLITIEGCPETIKIAQQNFQKLALQNIDSRLGQFETVLPQVLKTISAPALVFFDGNHRLKPTLDYFQQCKPLADDHSVFIFDDIHWSDEMEAAWEKIKNDDCVGATLDLFSLGIVFFRKSNGNKHFSIRY